MSRTSNRPALPASFYEKSVADALRLIGTMLVFYVGGGAVNAWIWLHSGLPTPVKLLVSVPAFLLAGQGMHLMGWIGHEGLHFNLSKNRHVSVVLGIFFSSMTALFVEMGMALDHWTHHRHTNTRLDPDLKLFEVNRSFVARMLFTRSRANRLYFRRAFRLALGRPLDDELSKIVFPMRLAQLRVYAAFNLACIAFWWAAYAAVALVDVRVFMVGFVIPSAVATVVSGLRPYIEHNGTQLDEWHNTRTRTSPLWTLLDVGGNYHLEHHLYPGVPQCRLPNVHRFLQEHAAYDAECHFDGTFLAHYRFASGAYVYPDGSHAEAEGILDAAMF